MIIRKSNNEYMIETKEGRIDFETFGQMIAFIIDNLDKLDEGIY